MLLEPALYSIPVLLDKTFLIAAEVSEEVWTAQQVPIFLELVLQAALSKALVIHPCEVCLLYDRRKAIGILIRPLFSLLSLCSICGCMSFHGPNDAPKSFDSICAVVPHAIQYPHATGTSGYSQAWLVKQNRLSQ